MSDFARRLRESRRVRIEAGHFVFYARRPTDIEAVGMVYTSRQDALEDVARFVEGWEGVKASDILDGEPDTEVPFEQGLFLEWIKDRPDLWQPLIDGVIDAYTAYRDRQEALGKP